MTQLTTTGVLRHEPLLRCHPLVAVDFVHGENCVLTDSLGRRYTDYESGSWAALLGHGHPGVTRALVEQASRLMHLGVRTPNRLARTAADSLLQLARLEDGRCTFLSSGSEAVEFGIQAIRKLTGRPQLLSLTESYLGAHGTATRRDSEDWFLLDWRRSLAEGTLQADLDQIPFDRIGGFVFEPGGSGPGFVHFPPDWLIADLSRRVRDQGGLILVNEVTTGMGRTGPLFGHWHYSLQPDLIALGKGLGNGYPISATLLSKSVGTALENTGHHHAQSHQNNPLGCAVAIAVLHALLKEGQLERGTHTGVRLQAGLAQLARSCPAIREVRGRGMLLALELAPGAPVDGSALQAALWDRQLIVAAYPAMHPAGTGIRLDPALTLDEASLNLLLETLGKLLHA